MVWVWGDSSALIDWLPFTETGCPRKAVWSIVPINTGQGFCSIFSSAVIPPPRPATEHECVVFRTVHGSSPYFKYTWWHEHVNEPLNPSGPSLGAMLVRSPNLSEDQGGAQMARATHAGAMPRAHDQLGTGWMFWYTESNLVAYFCDMRSEQRTAEKQEILRSTVKFLVGSTVRFGSQRSAADGADWWWSRAKPGLRHPLPARLPFLLVSQVSGLWSSTTWSRPAVI